MAGKPKRHLLAVALAGALLLGVAPSARAQSSADKAAAEALFQAGRDLMSSGKYDQACAKFEGSQKLDAGLGTLLFLADCYEKAGRLASAWATFREAESIASGRGDQARAQVAKGRYGALEPRLSKLWIKVADGNDPATLVKRDGEGVPRESWGVALPTDPGEHTIEASAPGRRPWSSKVTVQGEGANTPVEVPVLEAAPAEAPVATTSSPAPAPPPPVTPAEEPRPSHFQRTLSFVVGGVGIVGLGVGTYFTVRASGKKSESLKNCDTPAQPNVCSQAGVTLRDQALSSARLATVFMVGGGVLLAGGVVLYFTAPSSGPAKTGMPGGLRLVAGATPIGGHVGLTGDF
jgi:serine/threonine-protein kinase